MPDDYKDGAGTSQPLLLHRLFEGLDLGEVAVFVGADEEEPLVEVEGAPGGGREAQGAAAAAPARRRRGVRSGARVLESRARVGEPQPRRADALGRFELDAARALDELLDGDGVGEEVGNGRGRRARLPGLAQKFFEQADDV